MLLWVWTKNNRRNEPGKSIVEISRHTHFCWLFRFTIKAFKPQLSTPQYRLENEEIESNPAENLRVLLDENLSMAQQCVFTIQKSKSILGCIKSSRASKVTGVILPACFALVSPPWSAVFISGATSKRTWTCWTESRAEPKDDQRSGALLWGQIERVGAHQPG